MHWRQNFSRIEKEEEEKQGEQNFASNYNQNFGVIRHSMLNFLTSLQKAQFCNKNKKCGKKFETKVGTGGVRQIMNVGIFEHLAAQPRFLHRVTRILSMLLLFRFFVGVVGAVVVLKPCIRFTFA